MGYLKQAAQEYSEKSTMLQEFKITIENRIDYYRELIEQDIALLKYQRQEEAAEDTKEVFTMFPADLAVDIFSELGVSKTVLTIKEIFIEESDEPHYYYDFNELWSYLKNLKPFDFLIAMIVIASSNSQWKSVLKVQRLIVREIANYGFRISYYKPSVFVAMSFGKQMMETRKVIIDVIEEYGYDAMLIDIKEHNNQIVPEILFEIAKSTFVIADLTEHKTGVYLEIGYALAKQKQVILTCKDTDFDSRHFDVSQINIIKWKDKRDLEERLRGRIKSMHLDKL